MIDLLLNLLNSVFDGYQWWFLLLLVSLIKVFLLPPVNGVYILLNLVLVDALSLLILSSRRYQGWTFNIVFKLLFFRRFSLKESVQVLFLSVALINTFHKFSFRLKFVSVLINEARGFNLIPNMLLCQDLCILKGAFRTFWRFYKLSLLV